METGDTGAAAREGVARRIGRGALVLLMVLALSACANVLERVGLGGEPEVGIGGDEPQPIPGTDTPVPYEVVLNGVEDHDGLPGLMRDNGLLFRLEEEPPGTLLGLRRRMEADLETFAEVLRSQGYYGGTLNGRLETEAEPVRVVIDVMPGTRYGLAAFDIVYRDDPPAGAPRGIADIEDLNVGDPADADTILAAVEDLPDRLHRLGHPFAEVAGTRYVVNHDEEVLRAEVAMVAGPPALFGGVSFLGLERVEEDYLRTLAPWTPGEPWNEEKLRAYRQALLASGLFRSLRVEHAEEVGPDGRLPVVVDAQEAKMRSIGAGVYYNSDTGPGGQAFWEHRNLFGADEDLRVELELSALDQELSADFEKPAFLRPDQSLVARASLAREETDAFDRTGLDIMTGLERQVTEALTLGAGISLEVADVTDKNDGTSTFVRLVGLPLSAQWETTDDPLDPTQGTRLAATITPYAGVGDEALLFLRTEASAATYYTPGGEDGRVTLAGRIGLGSTAGETLAALPANKRFYAGGGGSVRGYAYQSIGPLGSRGDPVGGVSKLEANLEARVKVTESIGVVPFIDAGQVYESEIPDFARPLRFAAGVGLRYYTAIGPLRLDVAVPLNGREDDDAYQFYLSLGQAF